MEYLIDKSYKIYKANRIEESIAILEHTYKVFRGTTMSGSDFQATRFPTDNCQWASIGKAASILQTSDAKAILKDLNEVMGGRPMFMFDIKSTLSEALEALFPKEDIIMKSPYTSTNDSSMIIYLIKTNSLV